MEWLAIPISAGLVLITLASFMGGVSWVFDLFSHFRLQLALVAIFFCGVFTVFRQVVPVFATGLTALAQIVALVAYVLGGPGPITCQQTDPFSLVTMNLHHRHADIAAVTDFLRRQKPDIVLLTELLPEHEQALLALNDVLPFSARSGRSGSHEVMLLSRHDIRSSRFIRPLEDAPFLPLLVAQLCPDETASQECFTLIGFHAARPFAGAGEWQPAQFRFASDMAAEQPGGRVVVAGDLNTTPFSAQFSALLDGGGLRDTARGKGLKASWLSRNPLFGLKLDHILAGRGVAIRNSQLGPDVGSDHFPVIADLAICGS